MLGHYLSNLFQSLADPPRYHIPHMINHIRVKVLIIAISILFSCANSLKFVYVDIVLKGGSGIGLDHTHMQPAARLDQFPKSVARPVAIYAILAKLVGCAQNSQETVRIGTIKI